jgi:CCR4-NOT transcriptional complex subunit CAF120
MPQTYAKTAPPPADNVPQKRPPAEQQPPQPQPQQPAAPGQHPEIRSVVQLTQAHARKVYFSGPLVRRLERQPDGTRPLKDEGWVDVWAQLGGTTLSVWDMKLIAEASKEGKEVPPTYINVQDAVSVSRRLFINYLIRVIDFVHFIIVCAGPRVCHCTGDIFHTV